MHTQLQFGDSGPAVHEIIKLLILQNLIPSTTLVTNPTYNFDAEVDRGVREFQQLRGLLVDGIVDQTTYKALQESQYSLGTRELFYDPENLITGDDVSALQSRLMNLGFYSDNVDGVFGRFTSLGLMQYQREFGLVADGVCGPATIRSLKFLGLDISGGSTYEIKEMERTRQLGPYLKGKRICIDPGGATVNYNEIIMTPQGPLSYSDLLWDIATQTAQQLNRVGVEVIFSRAENSNPSDPERATVANESQCHFNISLRFAQYPNSKAQGVSTFYYGNLINSYSPLGKRFAIYLQKEIVARTPLLDCRYHERMWETLRLTTMPSVQVDLAYMTNPNDAHIIATPSYREAIAEAIVVSVKRLFLMGNNDQPTGTYTMSRLIQEEIARPQIF